MKDRITAMTAAAPMGTASAGTGKPDFPETALKNMPGGVRRSGPKACGDRAEAFMNVSRAGRMEMFPADMTRRAGIWMACDLDLALRGAVPRMGGDGYVRA